MFKVITGEWERLWSTMARAADRLDAIREAHSLQSQSKNTDRMEDYLEVIYELIKKKGVCHYRGHFKAPQRKLAQRDQDAPETR